MIHLLVAWMGLSISLTPAALPIADSPSVTFQLVPNTAAPGATVGGHVTITFPPGLQGYQNPPTRGSMIPVTVASASAGVTVRAKYPNGVLRKVGRELVAVYEGKVRIPVMITVPKSSGKMDIMVRVGYQRIGQASQSAPESVTLGMTLNVR